jgi:hypothetical protein
VKNLQTVYAHVKTAIREQILDKKVVLFLAADTQEWERYEFLYEQYQNDDAIELYGIRVPVAFKDFFGKADFGKADFHIFPDAVYELDWEKADIRLLSPDIIYIQNPYDGENPCLTQPPYFYAKNLKNFTDKLVYVSDMRVQDFSKEDVCDIYNMKHYVTAPALMYADEILVFSENMKKQYVEKLTEFAGEGTRDVWEEKVHVACLPRKEQAVAVQKRLFYCIGENEFYEKKEDFLGLIRQRLEIIAKERANIRLTLSFYPPDIKTWKDIGTETAQELDVLMKEYEQEDWFTLCDLSTVKWSEIAAASTAYYGSPSPLVHLFTEKKKPVMISE